jgi:3-isopropylmalate/(R)-2-methylmalate dehydratase small subunit
MRTLTGPARVYARPHINTDEIIPARYLMTSDEEELAKHAMEDIDPEFAGSVEPGTILVVGQDFGCGSSREHAVWSLRGAGVQAVVGESFARIFFRNAINNGFRAIECPGVAATLRTGDDVELDMDAGELRVPDRGITLPLRSAGEFAERLMAAGGLMPYVAAKLRRDDPEAVGDAEEAVGEEGPAGSGGKDSPQSAGASAGGAS